MDLIPADITIALPDRTSPKLCQFDLGTGAKCMSPHYARGFCDSHYRSLKRSGAFADLPAPSKPKSSHAVTLANVAKVKKARRKLANLAPDFVDHLFTGSRIAAQSGKTEAAQWALLHTRVIEPIAEKTTPGSSGTTINIGVKVSGSENR